MLRGVIELLCLLLLREEKKLSILRRRARVKMTARYFLNPLHDTLPTAGPGWASQRAVDLAKVCLARSNQSQLHDEDFTVYTGSAGLAYMCLRMSDPDLCDDPADKDLFQKMAQLYLQMAEEASQRVPSTGTRVPSLLCGQGGVLLVSALMNYELRGDIPAAHEAARVYLNIVQTAASAHFDKDEFLFGRAGVLFGLLWLQKVLGAGVIPDASILTLGRAIVLSGREYVKAGKLQRRGFGLPPMFWEWHHERYLGCAHGALGIVYTLLLVPENIWGEDRSILRDTLATLDFVLTQWSDNDKNLPSALGRQSAALVHWCHGAPGVVFTCCTAYQVTKDQRYLDAAVRAGDTVWERGLLKKGPGLCHGVSGNAYAFLSLYCATNDEKYLRRTHRFTEFMNSGEFAAEAALQPDHPYSLYEGLAGAACLYADLGTGPRSSRFPFFGL